MCGRLDVNRISRLVQDFAWADQVFNRSQAKDNVNAAPGTFRSLFHYDEAALFVDDVHWGYRSAWAEASGKIPMAINTRLDKILNPYWKPLIYLAALVGHGAPESKTANGFTIVTAASDAGMLDIHDRRPIVLDPTAASMWLKPDLAPEEAVEILHNLSAPTEAFAWHMVDKAIGNVRNQDSSLAKPINI